MNKQNLLKDLDLQLDSLKAQGTVTAQKLHDTLSSVIMKYINTDWHISRESHLDGRRACYFSMEFLIGRSIYNNLLCLDICTDAAKIFESHGFCLNDLEDIEDAALGNGGLGRLAACFLDSAATMNIPLDGYGIRYRYGLFRQKIVNGFQTEEADDWTRYGDPWSVRCEEETVLVKYNNQTVKAVPYDMPVIGYGIHNIGTLRLWQAEPVNKFDFHLFNDQKYLEASSEAVHAEDISRVLYPNDDTDEGKKLRLKQQYFFTSASLTDIIRKHKAKNRDIHTLSDYVSIQLNDTHPVISIPELIRQLTADEGMSFDEAMAAAQKIFNYTNHTIMPEALEKWNCELVKELLPDIYNIIFMINENLISDLYAISYDVKAIENMKIIRGGQVHMANLATYCCAHVNGVAEIHTEILKEKTLHDWYEVYPDKFQNKTNGITQRRWLALCNKELSGLITGLLDSNKWITDLSELKKLLPYADDEKIIEKFLEIKSIKKKQLADYILKKDGISVDENTIFDIQIKRLHEYKRQLLNAFSIMYIYFGIKDGSITDFTPTTFIFGAKSAPGYARAKAIIKYINEIAEYINKDEEVRDLIKVVFISNYNVSYAEKLVAAADISEQISTAGTEASGTGNMKLMLNGAVTLGTMDGANIEIVQEAGKANNYIFGATVDVLEKVMPAYSSRKIMSSNPKIRAVVETLIDGTFDDGGSGDFRELYQSLLDGASWHTPDNYYLLGDLEAYVKTKLKCNKDYTDKNAFGKKMWINMCCSGKFSSDRTIIDYAKNIWKCDNE
ncbi:MAG: glycogen/starch/alpha-glucan phosphorylase [Oscillospiraceae bacterium]|nr:glycogen/starch/alpha-glucan phosphorylase [Oscillospiraceae bacterium]